jgi:hypothetical protein
MGYRDQVAGKRGEPPNERLHLTRRCASRRGSIWRQAAYSQRRALSVWV